MLLQRSFAGFGVFDPVERFVVAPREFERPIREDRRPIFFEIRDRMNAMKASEELFSLDAAFNDVTGDADVADFGGGVSVVSAASDVTGDVSGAGSGVVVGVGGAVSAIVLVSRSPELRLELVEIFMSSLSERFFRARFEQPELL